MPSNVAGEERRAVQPCMPAPLLRRPPLCRSIQAAPCTSAEQAHRLASSRNLCAQALQTSPPLGVPATVQACLDCQGVVIFTGVGKSGLIAQKICQTLVSTGTKAVFLSPQVGRLP